MISTSAPRNAANMALAIVTLADGVPAGVPVDARYAAAFQDMGEASHGLLTKKMLRQIQGFEKLPGNGSDYNEVLESIAALFHAARANKKVPREAIESLLSGTFRSMYGVTQVVNAGGKFCWNTQEHEDSPENEKITPEFYEHFFANVGHEPSYPLALSSLTEMSSLVAQTKSCASTNADVYMGFLRTLGKTSEPDMAKSMTRLFQVMDENPNITLDVFKALCRVAEKSENPVQVIKAFTALAENKEGRQLATSGVLKEFLTNLAPEKDPSLKDRLVAYLQGSPGKSKQEDYHLIRESCGSIARLAKKGFAPDPAALAADLNLATQKGLHAFDVLCVREKGSGPSSTIDKSSFLCAVRSQARMRKEVERDYRR